MSFFDSLTLLLLLALVKIIAEQQRTHSFSSSSLSLRGKKKSKKKFNTKLFFYRSVLLRFPFCCNAQYVLIQLSPISALVGSIFASSVRVKEISLWKCRVFQFPTCLITANNNRCFRWIWLNWRHCWSMYLLKLSLNLVSLPNGRPFPPIVSLSLTHFFLSFWNRMKSDSKKVCLPNTIFKYNQFYQQT